MASLATPGHPPSIKHEASNSEFPHIIPTAHEATPVLLLLPLSPIVSKLNI